MAQAAANAPLKKLPLDAVWRARQKNLGIAKFADFAGYDMPIQFEGLIAEHHWTRTHAGLFDVSHMGPCFLAVPTERYEPTPEGDQAQKRDVAAIIEKLVPADIQGLASGQIRYTMLLNEDGGVLDDLMVAWPNDIDGSGVLYIVVNAGAKEQDFALIAAAAGDGAELKILQDHVLLALQGPEAFDVLSGMVPALNIPFMQVQQFLFGDPPGGIFISRSGYTGEDGFEILAEKRLGEQLAERLLADPRVKPIGLGARDSLRLEAGLCLYGHDLDAATSPIEAGLAWTIQKTRRDAADFPGAARILSELREKPARKRVGIRPKDRAPAREGVEIYAGEKKIGAVTSGGFSPILNAPISMGYVETAFSKVGTTVDLLVRGQRRPAEIVVLPFVPHRYVRKP